MHSGSVICTAISIFSSFSLSCLGCCSCARLRKSFFFEIHSFFQIMILLLFQILLYTLWHACRCLCWIEFFPIIQNFEKECQIFFFTQLSKDDEHIVWLRDLLCRWCNRRFLFFLGGIWAKWHVQWRNSILILTVELCLVQHICEGLATRNCRSRRNSAWILRKLLGLVLFVKNVRSNFFK